LNSREDSQRRRTLPIAKNLNYAKIGKFSGLEGQTQKILKQTKGNFLARRNVWTVAKNTYEKGLTYAYRDRKNKKRTFRALWIQRINAAARMHGMSYSQFMGKMNKANVGLNRKVLADLAMNNPQAFEAVINSIK